VSSPNPSDTKSHFFLDGRDKASPEKKKKQRPKDGPARFPHTSGSEKGVLSAKASLIREHSLDRKTIFNDNRLYFILKFSDSFSWKSIRSTLESLGGEVTQTYDDTKVKLALAKERYHSFLVALEKGRKYIIDIVESMGSEKIDEQLAKSLDREPNLPQNVTIEVVDLSGLRFLQQLDLALNEYVEQQGGEVRLAYNSRHFAVFTASLYPSALREVADKVEVVEHVHGIPQISLADSTRAQTDIGLASLMSMARANSATLPVVCAIDTGINRDHKLLSNYIEDVADFSDVPAVTCSDTDGHGSMVAGVVVYGGNCRTHTNPTAKIIMVKGFENRNRPIDEVLQMIVRTVDRFLPRSKVFNFSFAAFGPNPTLTKALDDMIYYRDIVVAACTGNIDKNNIRFDLENNRPYPDYLLQHPIFFPGDCKNAITIGAFSAIDSNICRKNSPSPFTRAGVWNEMIKPDLVEDGGNVNAKWEGNNVIDITHNGVGISSASFQQNDQLIEDVGSSFSCPAVASLAANILKKYPSASPALIKAIVLSSCTPLQESTGKHYHANLQGFGVPDFGSSIGPTRWRTYYLIQGAFDATAPDIYRSYRFLFPDNADRFRVTLTCTRPADSKTFLNYRLIKSGSKLTSKPPKPRTRMGLSKVTTTYQAVYDVVRGGKGPWTIDIFPHYDQSLGIDKSIKYGCVISVESSKHLDVYSPISNWVKPVKQTALITEFI
jgi:hypothetical protein